MPTINFTTEVPVLVDGEEDFVVIDITEDIDIERGQEDDKDEVLLNLNNTYDWYVLNNTYDWYIEDFIDTDYLNDDWEEHFEKNFEYDIEWDDEEEE